MRRMMQAALFVVLAAHLASAQTVARPSAAQQVSPRLLEAGREAYEQQQGQAPSLLASRPDQEPSPQRTSPMQNPSPVQDVLNWENLDQLHVGDPIACRTKYGAIRGKFRAVSSEAITLKVGKHELTLPREQVVSVRRRRRGHRGETAWLGAAIGFGAGALIGAGRVPSQPALGALEGAGLGAPFGAVAGALAGLAHRNNPLSDRREAAE